MFEPQSNAASGRFRFFKKWGIMAGVAVLSLSLGGVAISQIDKKTKDDLYSQIEIFSYALTTIQSEYVDEQKPKDLIYGSLKGMLSSLDPHSQFLTPEDYDELKTETQGKFGGLGIEISIKDGLLTVISPIEDTPAWKAGIKPNDRIMKIGDDETKDMTLSDAVKKLRGAPGTDVKITILRESEAKMEAKIQEITITREIIRVQDIKDAQILDDHIGYLRLTEFREDSYNEFHKALKKLKEDGADSVVVDLRYNPGGLLNVAIKITEEFLPEGKLIVSTKGRRSSQNTEAKSTNTSKDFTEWPVVVLINKGSASGSEIFAGALKDNKRAVILGEKSFGKGSVQSVIPLPDGSGLRLTTAKYFTPSGVCIHGIGIQPDVEIKPRPFSKDKDDQDTDQKDDIEKKFDDIKKHDSHETTPKSSDDTTKTDQDKKIADSKKLLLEDNQVQAALSVIKGIRVYKGFGQSLASLQAANLQGNKGTDANKTKEK